MLISSLKPMEVHERCLNCDMKSADDFELCDDDDDGDNCQTTKEIKVIFLNNYKL